MNTCDTCKWWNKPQKLKDGGGSVWMNELGQCMNERLLQTPYSPRRIDEEAKSKPDDAYIDLEWAKLQTGPKFGCIYHEF